MPPPNPRPAGVSAHSLRKELEGDIGRIDGESKEIDLLTEEGGQVVLVEVKASASAAIIPLSRRFRPAQRARQRAAARWLAGQPAFKNASFRHDLVMVTFDGRRSVVTIRRNVLNLPRR